MSLKVQPHWADTPCVGTLDAWHAYLAVTVAPSTARKYWDDVMRFLDARDFRTMTEDDVLVFLGTLRPGVRFNAYWAVKSLYRWALRRGHVVENPTVAISIPHLMQREPKALSREDVARLRASARRRSVNHEALVDFLYFTGARIGEATTAQWSHDRGDSLVLVGAKGRAERTVAVHPELRKSLDALRVLRTLEGWQPESIFGRSKCRLYQSVKEAAGDAGLADVHPHTLRATMATLLADAGASAKDIQRLLGHKSLSVTERYIASTTSSRARTISLL